MRNGSHPYDAFYGYGFPTGKGSHRVMRFMDMDSLLKMGHTIIHFYENNYGECLLRVLARLVLLYVQFPCINYQFSSFNVLIYPV